MIMRKLSVTMTRTEKILGWIYLPLQLLVIPSVIFLVNLLIGNPLSDAESNFIFFCVNFICITLIFRRFLIQSAKVAIRTPFRCLQGAFLGFILYWVLSIVIGYVIMALYPDFYNVNDSSIGSMVQENSTLMAFGTVLLVPITEEVLYRGLIFRGLYNHSRFAAYAVSTAVFAALHVVGYIGMFEPLHLLLCFVQYLPAGLCLGWAYARADSIWAPILIHITINQLGIISMG